MTWPTHRSTHHHIFHFHYYAAKYAARDLCIKSDIKYNIEKEKCIDVLVFRGLSVVSYFLFLRQVLVLNRLINHDTTVC